MSSLQQQALTVSIPLLTYLTIGPSLVLVNRHIMKDLHFDFPITLSCLGLLASAVSVHVGAHFGMIGIRPAVKQEMMCKSTWYRTALPVALCKAVSLAAGNIVYLHLGLGLVNMMKAFGPVVTLCVMTALRVARPRRSAVWFVLIVVAGTCMTVFKGNMRATASGVLIMISSQIAEAFTNVLTQQLLQNRKLTVAESLYVLSPLGAICLLVAAMVLECPRMISQGHTVVVSDHMLCFCGAAMLGVAVNFGNNSLIQVTSTLFVKILNQVRSVCLVMIGHHFYQEKCGLPAVIGYSLALMGFIGYTFVQAKSRFGADVEQRVDFLSSLIRDSFHAFFGKHEDKTS